MPFIGTQPEVGGYSVLDALTASATASYTLQKDSANFVPNSANQLLVSLNGVIQKPGSSFTVSGSTLTFSSALDSSDSIDFILAMGEPLLIGTPSDGTVSTAKIANDAVTGAKIENNPTIAGNLAVAGTTTLNANTTLSKSGAAELKVMTTDDNTFAQVLIQDVNAGYSWQVRSDNAQSTTDGALLLNDQRGTFPIIIDENNATNTFKLSNSVYTGKLILSGNSPGSFAFGNHATWTNAIDLSGQPAGTTIKASFSMQNNSLYSACIYIFKTQNSHYFQVGYANNSGLQLRINGTYIQTYQNSGANQTSSGGSARVYLGGGIT